MLQTFKLHKRVTKVWFNFHHKLILSDIEYSDLFLALQFYVASHTMITFSTILHIQSFEKSLISY